MAARFSDSDAVNPNGMIGSLGSTPANRSRASKKRSRCCGSGGRRRTRRVRSGRSEWRAGSGASVRSGNRRFCLLPLDRAHPLLLWPDRDWLAGRIDARFGRMLEDGALDEVRAVLPIWDPAALWAKAIGAPELVAHLRGDLPLDVARLQAQAASRQYAKRQRTWFRRRMRDWTTIALP